MEETRRAYTTINEKPKRYMERIDRLKKKVFETFPEIDYSSLLDVLNRYVDVTRCEYDVDYAEEKGIQIVLAIALRALPPPTGVSAMSFMVPATCGAA